MAFYCPDGISVMKSEIASAKRTVNYLTFSFDTGIGHKGVHCEEAGCFIKANSLFRWDEFTFKVRVGGASLPSAADRSKWAEQISFRFFNISGGFAFITVPRLPATD